jgi:hypothetical protein
VRASQSSVAKALGVRTSTTVYFIFFKDSGFCVEKLQMSG